MFRIAITIDFEAQTEEQAVKVGSILCRQIEDEVVELMSVSAKQTINFSISKSLKRRWEDALMSKGQGE